MNTCLKLKVLSHQKALGLSEDAEVLLIGGSTKAPKQMTVSKNCTDYSRAPEINRNPRFW